MESGRRSGSLRRCRKDSAEARRALRCAEKDGLRRVDFADLGRSPSRLWVNMLRPYEDGNRGRSMVGWRRRVMEM